MIKIPKRDDTQAERWRNVAQAAQWLAEGREVEIFNQTTNRWELLPEKAGALTVSWQYRPKPEPPKPRVAYVCESRLSHKEPWHYHRTLINPTDREIAEAHRTLFDSCSGRGGSKDSGNVRIRKFVEEVLE